MVSAMARQLVLLLWQLLLVIGGSNGCPDLAPPNCDVTLDSLGALVTGDLAQYQVVCVTLPPDGAEEIRLSYTNISLSLDTVVIRGNNRVVSCQEEPAEVSCRTETRTSLGEVYPLHFKNTRRVYISDINFQQCQQPLLFNRTAGLISIVSSNFR